MSFIKEQIEFIKSVKLQDGQRKTLNCPFCGATKKFTVSRMNGKIVWNCYKASCYSRGAVRCGYSLDTIKDYKVGFKTIPKSASTPMPTVLSHPKHHPKVMSYLKTNNSLAAFENNLIQIGYDPAKDRVLFVMNNGRGAVGRSLSGKNPKWLTYADTTGLLTVGRGRVGVIVEDAASACSVGVCEGFTGVSILGTNVSTTQMSQLRMYSSLIICLDKDASKTALRLCKKLSLPNLIVLFLDEDLKYLNKIQIECLLLSKLSESPKSLGKNPCY